MAATRSRIAANPIGQSASPADSVDRQPKRRAIIEESRAVASRTARNDNQEPSMSIVKRCAVSIVAGLLFAIAAAHAPVVRRHMRVTLKTS